MKIQYFPRSSIYMALALLIYQQPLQAKDWILSPTFSSVDAFTNKVDEKAKQMLVPPTISQRDALIDNVTRTAQKNWRYSPSLVFGEIYTDNLNLTATEKETALITEISPGIVITRNTNRIKFNLNYKLQNLLNASSGENNIFHILNFSSQAQAIKNTVFLDLRASNTQQNINNRFLTNNNINNSANRVNVTTYGVSPVWTPHFNGLASGSIRFNFDQLNSDSRQLSSTTQTGFTIDMQSDQRWSKNNSLRFHHNDNNQERVDGGAVTSLNDELEYRHYLNRNVNAFGILGYSDSGFQTNNNNNAFQNGGYYTFGLQWKPLRQFKLEAGYGNNSYATLDLSPFRNVNWVTTFRNRQIGTNLGNTWQSSFLYQAIHASISANYAEDTISAQSALLSQIAQSYTSSTIYQQLPERLQEQLAISQQNQLNNNSASLNNQIYIRKKATAGFQYKTVRTLFDAQLFNERRFFQGGNDSISGLDILPSTQEVYGGFATFSWRFLNSTNVYISPYWQRIRDSSTDSALNANSTRQDLSVGLLHGLPFKFDRKGSLKTSLEYRYSKQTSDNINYQFDENRITANFLLNF